MTDLKQIAKLCKQAKKATATCDSSKYCFIGKGGDKKNLKIVVITH